MKSRLIFRIMAFAALCLLCSCITNKGTTLLQTDEKLPQYPKAEYEYYRICPNDVLVMRIFTLNTESASIFNNDAAGYRVYDDGTIDIPFISGIPVAGLTVREASKVVEQYVRQMVPDAMVKVALQNDCFYVVGSGESGSYQLYKERLNIFQALALMGSLEEEADRSRVTVIRHNPDGGRPTVRQFDLRTASVIDSEHYYVQPNDVIYIPAIQGEFFQVSDYTSTLGSISSSINFLLTVFNFGKTYNLWK